MYEFLWNAMSKGGMEIWHSIVRVHSIVQTGVLLVSDMSFPTTTPLRCGEASPGQPSFHLMGYVQPYNQRIGGQHLGMLLM